MNISLDSFQRTAEDATFAALTVDRESTGVAGERVQMAEHSDWTAKDTTIIA